MPFVAWVDFDNDGDLDLSYCGGYGNFAATKLYRNDRNGVFTDISCLDNVENGVIIWGDYDKNGTQDVLITGRRGSYDYIAKLYKNQIDTFICDSINSNLFAQVRYSSAAWGDYNQDGNLDLVITGSDNTNAMQIFIYKNLNGVFSQISTPEIVPASQGKAVWRDFDNDGDLDLAVTGQKLYNGSEFETNLYSNNGNDIFIKNLNANLTAARRSSLEWGDFNHDKKLDLVLTGQSGSGNYHTKVFVNNTLNENTQPNQPTELTVLTYSDSAKLIWNQATDNQTLATGLTYNVRIGTTTGSDNILVANAFLENGNLKIPKLGINDTFRIIDKLPAGTYFWAVQTIDNEMLRSNWSQECSLTTPNFDSQTPTAVISSPTNVDSFSVTLNAQINAHGSNTNISFEYGTTDTLGLSISANPANLNDTILHSVSANIENLNLFTTYYFRVKAESNIGTTYSNYLTFTTLGANNLATATTKQATEIKATTAILNGIVNANYTPTETFFEFGTDTFYGNQISATPSNISGNQTTNISANISNLSPNTTYHFRVKAQNSVGISYGNDFIFTTLNSDSLPEATTLPATNISAATATLHATVNARGNETQIFFQIGYDTTYQFEVLPNPSQLNNNSSVEVNFAVSGLKPNIAYHYRIVAISEIGTTYGNDVTFNTQISTCPRLNYYSYFSQMLNNQYNDISNHGTEIPVSNLDDGTSDILDIGFPFFYNGETFTQFRLSTNGFIKLGNIPFSSPFLYFDAATVNTGGIFNATDSADIYLLVR